MTALSEPDYVIPWERQPGEGPKPYALFCHYRDMGPGRTFEMLATDETVTYSRNTIREYSAKYSWTVRLNAYDDYVRRIEQEEYFRETRLMARRHTQRAAEMLEALMAPVEALQARLVEDPVGTMDELKGQPVHKLMTQVQASARVLQPIMNAERLAQGLPTAITEGREEHVHSIDRTSVDRIGEILQSLEDTNLLAHFLGEGTVSEVVDAEAIDLDPRGLPPETDSLSPSPPP